MDYKSSKTVLVISTMSSGKSTLINAIIGKDILPSRNMACTGKIITYTSDNSLKSVESNIYGRKIDNLESKDIDLLNEDNNLDRIDLYGPIYNDLDNNVNIKLIDTPGINNSKDSTHKDITYKALEEEQFDTILYIINATQIGINDDAYFLAKLKKYIKENPKKDIIFVLNKIDEIDIEEEDIKEIYENTMKYISKTTGIDKPNLTCISSYYAKLRKMQKNGISLNKRENMHLELYIDYIEDVKIKELNNLNYLKDIEIKNEDKLLDEVGMYGLEKYLFDGINREERYINIHSKLYEIKEFDCVKKYKENISTLFNKLNENNLLDYNIRELKDYLKNISYLNSSEARILLDILIDYEDNPVIFSIIKSLRYACNDEKRKRFMKFDKVLRELDEDINIDEKITTEEILDFIIEEIKLKENDKCDIIYSFEEFINQMEKQDRS